MKQKAVTKVPLFKGSEPTQFHKDALAFLAERFNQFKAQREDNSNDGYGFSFEDKFRQTDYMWHAARSRTVMSSETQTVGTRSEDDKVPRADVGSKMFFRSTVTTSGRVLKNVKLRDGMDLPWRYVRPKNRANQSYIAENEYDKTNEKAQSVARYSMEKDNYNEKVTRLAIGLAKYGNLPVVFDWKTEEREILTRSGDTRSAKTIKEEYFTFDPLDVACVWADVIGGPLENQETVFYRKTLPIHAIHSQRDKFEPKAYDVFWKKKNNFAIHTEQASDAIENRNVNRGGEELTRDIDSEWALWYAFAWLPMDGDNIADETSDSDKVKYELIRFTMVGSTPAQDILPLAAERHTTPDDKIPLSMIWLVPDEDASKLYHLMPIELIRSDYAVTTTFINMAIDNGREINEPKRIVNTNILTTLNMDDDVWYADDVQNAVLELRPPNVIDACMRVRAMTQQEGESALVMSENSLGQAYGARTTANEAILIERSLAMAEAVMNGYGATLFLRAFGHKCRQYWTAYANATIDIEVSGSSWIKIERDDLWGDYSVTVDVIDNEEQDALNMRAMDTLIGYIAQSPALQSSTTHTIDMGEMLRDSARYRGMHRAPSWIIPAGDEDAKSVATIENEQMNAGNVAQVLPNQRHDVHEATHQPEIYRLRQAMLVLQQEGMMAGPDMQNLRNLQAIYDEHMQQHHAMKAQERAQQQAQAQAVAAGGGTLPAQPNFQNVGQIAQGELGAQTGGR